MLKKCEYCGGDIVRKEGVSDSRYYIQVYCSVACCKSGSRKKTHEHDVRDATRDFTKRYGGVKHGKNHPIYNAWLNMKRRCYYKNSRYYKNYGGRGITVCAEWVNGYVGFMNWALSSGWKPKLSLDRINNDGNYEPSNCRWATRRQQLTNKRTNRFISYLGETKTITERAESIGMSINGLVKRLEKHDAVYSLTTPLNKRYSHPKSV